MWSYIGDKSCQCWLWWAIDHVQALEHKHTVRLFLLNFYAKKNIFNGYSLVIFKKLLFRHCCLKVLFLRPIFSVAVFAKKLWLWNSIICARVLLRLSSR
jgi:hypothetical protein